MRAMILILVLLSSEALAQSQEQCAPRDQMLRFLADRYKETPQESGKINGDWGTLEVFMSKDGKTWSIIVTRAGESCMKAGGTDWLGVAKSEWGQKT